LKFLYIAVALSLSLIPSSGASQTDPLNEIINWSYLESGVRCDIEQPEVYHNGVEYFYGETPLFQGSTRMFLYDETVKDFMEINGIMTFYVNQSTGTYSVAVFFQDGSYCEISNGEKFMPYVIESK